MIPAIRLASVSQSRTYEMMELAASMKVLGKNVISLAGGEPDFETPLHIRQAAIEAINRGETRYTAAAGMRTLREAVAKKFRLENGLACDWQRTIVSTGAKQVIANAFLATLDPGDEVLIPSPNWVSYPDMALLCGATPVVVQTTAQNGFKLQPKQLRASLTKRTKWLVINSPCNPTGAVYSEDELRGLANVLLDHPSVLVLTDDIYEHIVFAPIKFCTIAQVEPRLADRVLTVNGVSKAYAMTGWRIGYATGPEDLIREMIKVQGQQTSSACSISQWAALAALSGPQDFIETARSQYTERRDLVVTAIKATPHLECASPAGAFYAFISCEAALGRRTGNGLAIKNDEDFVRRLLEEEGVALVSGSAFGAKGYVRLSYAASIPDLTEACIRIRSFFEELH